MLGMIAERREGNSGDYGAITLEMLEALTQKSLIEEDVIARNEVMTEAYRHVVVSYGFQDFYSLYLYALSNTQAETMKSDSGGSGSKDYTSMSRVRRTIVRDGKRTEVTLYEKPRGLDNKQKVGSRGSKQAEAKGPATGAIELNILAQGEIHEPIPTSELHAIDRMVEGYVVEGEIKDLDRIKVYLDENMFPKAVQGLRIEGEFLTTPFKATDGHVQGIEQRMFFEMVKVALNWGLGVRMGIEETNIQDILAQTSELEEVGGYYQLEFEGLLEAFGELP